MHSATACCRSRCCGSWSWSRQWSSFRGGRRCRRGATVMKNRVKTICGAMRINQTRISNCNRRVANHIGTNCLKYSVLFATAATTCNGALHVLDDALPNCPRRGGMGEAAIWQSATAHIVEEAILLAILCTSPSGIERGGTSPSAALSPLMVI